jgi:transcriptional accessory protein Tex/SPT6
LSNNYSVGQQTKHIDTRVHFFKEFIEDGILKIKFVTSEGNDADYLTKNATEEVHERGTNKMMDNLDTKPTANYKEGC